jgi:DNA replication and repair protein RecF
MTHTGPHRDELIFKLDDLEVRRYASHGQHRTFVLALKLAQFFYLKERLGETPLFLLDDVFDNLDPGRIALFAELLSAEGRQSLVTAARGDLFSGAVDFLAERHRALDIPISIIPASS